MKAIENVFQGMGHQVDLMNTLSGGSSQTTMNVDRQDDRLVVTLSAPGVSASSFNIVVEGNKLILYTLLMSEWSQQNADGTNQRLAVPMFLRVLDIPAFVDTDQIEAVHEHGKVRVMLPFKDEEQMHRRIDIKNPF